MTKMISRELLLILACPKCKGKLKLPSPKNGLICETCQLFFEIRDNIPIMLVEEAKKLEVTG